MAAYVVMPVAILIGQLMIIASNRRVNVDDKQRLGFSLIELLVAVLVLSLVFIWGVPSYRAQLREASAQQAAHILLKNAEYMEKYYAQCGNYGRDINSTAIPPCVNGLLVASRIAWPTLPYPYSPESGSPSYFLSFSSTAPSPCTSSSNCSGINNYRLIARPICGTVAATNNCSCVDSNGNANAASGSADCNICVDQDNNIIYNANDNCGN
jgi:prepilin-type N-terminal cleavage/methylation domain-containing protein